MNAEPQSASGAPTETQSARLREPFSPAMPTDAPPPSQPIESASTRESVLRETETNR